ncbi:MAG TPA: divergent polysaccharide deacetylase family protein [Thermoanaerobaculia bacterium]|nr:divergent polysaccharide deacetylase family protein [Thermoanaerobaculia bacterium]
MNDRGSERRGPIRRSDPLGPRPPFRVLAATLALPLLGFLLFLGYQWVAGDVRLAGNAGPALDEAPRATEAAAVVESPGPPPAAAPGRPEAGRIVLILDDVGYDRGAAEQAAALGTTISFAVIPGTPHAASSASFLFSRGFEILCHLPMEPEGYPAVSPGEGAILRSMSDDEIHSRTRAMVRSVPHAKGVNNHMGSAATSDARVMQKVLEAIAAEGVFFIDSRTTPHTVSRQLASRLGVRAAARDVFLDADTSEEAIRAQIERLARLADGGDIAIGIGHLYPTTIRVLRDELPRLEERGYRFLRASEAVQ